jgi:predicted nucleic acid-binding protein
MTLPDTCAWAEVLPDTPTGQRCRKLFEQPAEWVVPTLVQYELRRWALRERADDAADRLIDASALRQQALRVTCDANFAGAAGVDYPLKAAPAAQGRR